MPHGREEGVRRTGIHPDYWYPVARADRVKRGRTLAVRFAGERIVLGRTESDQLFALEDRCAHRQIPLSMGVIEGERLRCAYHGWVYSTAGRCVSAPYLPESECMPLGVRHYPSREAYGHVFIFPGNPLLAENVSLPVIPTWGVRSHKTMYFAREVKCHYSFMHENLMDMTHQVLHRGLMGNIRPSIQTVRRADGLLEVDYRFQRPPGRLGWGPRVMVRVKPGDSPDRDHAIITIATRYPYQELCLALPSGAVIFNMWAVYVPLGPAQNASQTFGMVMIRKPAVPGVIYLLWPLVRLFTEKVFAQDRQAVEAEQRAHDEQGADWNRKLPRQGHQALLDSAGVEGRGRKREGGTRPNASCGRSSL
jgi:phenylpropionate dioxygenase-like ring-hydroxylating dioxygenase large terminal subunit